MPQGVERLLVGSGKSVSCSPQGLVRGMAACMVIGQAAGAAAALAAHKDVSPRELDVCLIQDLLCGQGVDLI